MKNLDKLKYFDPKRLTKIANLHVGKFFLRVTKEGRDYKGNQFKPYSKDYLKLLEKDFRKKNGGRYAGYEGIALNTSGEKRSKRPLELRGLSMNNLRVRGSAKDSYTIGWDGEPAAIIEGNARKGRNVIDDLPPDEWQWVVDQLGDAVEDEWKKVPNVTRIKV